MRVLTNTLWLKLKKAGCVIFCPLIGARLLRVPVKIALIIFQSKIWSTLGSLLVLCLLPQTEHDRNIGESQRKELDVCSLYSRRGRFLIVVSMLTRGRWLARYLTAPAVLYPATTNEQNVLLVLSAASIIVRCVRSGTIIGFRAQSFEIKSPLGMLGASLEGNNTQTSTWTR